MVNQINPFPEMTISSPVIACVQEDPILVSDRNFRGLHPSFQIAAIEDCSNPALGFPGAIWMGGSQVIVLCPRFFTFPPKPTRKACLAVDSVTNEYKSTGFHVAGSQNYVLLHELVHLYIGARIDQRRIPREAYTVQDCFGLKAGYSRYNPANYVYYVNSKSPIEIQAMIFEL